jgi:hypothetical protein
MTQYVILYFDYCGAGKVMIGVTTPTDDTIAMLTGGKVGQPRVRYMREYAPLGSCASPLKPQ